MRIFVAGPLGDHNPPDVIAANTDRADQLARDLMALGNQVYCPHSHSRDWGKDKRLTTEQFYALDKTFLMFWAEAIVRIPGESKGADGEMKLAMVLGLHVVDEQGNILVKGTLKEAHDGR